MLGQWPDAWTHLVLLQVWPMATGKSVSFQVNTCESSDFFVVEALVLKERVMIARAKHWRWGKFAWSSLVSRRNFFTSVFFLPHYQYHLLPPLPATSEEGEHHHRRKGGSAGEGRGTSSTPGAKMGRDTLVETLSEACGAVCGGRWR